MSNSKQVVSFSVNFHVGYGNSPSIDASLDGVVFSKDWSIAAKMDSSVLVYRMSDCGMFSQFNSLRISDHGMFIGGCSNDDGVYKCTTGEIYKTKDVWSSRAGVFNALLGVEWIDIGRAGFAVRVDCLELKDGVYIHKIKSSDFEGQMDIVFKASADKSDLRKPGANSTCLCMREDVIAFDVQRTPTITKCEYPSRGRKYTMMQVLRDLDLKDSPHFCFEVEGVDGVIQGWPGVDDMLANPELANTKWVYERTTDEWIPIFNLSSASSLIHLLDTYKDTYYESQGLGSAEDDNIRFYIKGCKDVSEYLIPINLEDAIKAKVDAEEAYNGAQCTCSHCGRSVRRDELRKWTWYDFYAAQGDEPLRLCKYCWTEPRHQKRMEKDREDYESEMRGYDRGWDD